MKKNEWQQNCDWYHGETPYEWPVMKTFTAVLFASSSKLSSADCWSQHWDHIEDVLIKPGRNKQNITPQTCLSPDWCNTNTYNYRTSVHEKQNDGSDILFDKTKFLDMSQMMSYRWNMKQHHYWQGWILHRTFQQNLDINGCDRRLISCTCLSVRVLSWL